MLGKALENFGKLDQGLGGMRRCMGGWASRVVAGGAMVMLVACGGEPVTAEDVSGSKLDTQVDAADVPGTLEEVEVSGDDAATDSEGTPEILEDGNLTDVEADTGASTDADSRDTRDIIDLEIQRDTVEDRDTAAPDSNTVTGPLPPDNPDAPLPSKSGESDYYDETVTVETPGAGLAPTPALPGSGPWWRLSWADEFNGPQPGEDPTCYSRKPQCMPRVSWGPTDCPAEAAPQLANLNKCNWSVYNFYNYMNGPESEGRNVNAFDWSEVRVAEGTLTLGARSEGSDRTDCGRLFDDPHYAPYGNHTTDCAFISGGIESRPFDNPWNGTDFGDGDVRGFDQTFGRFEVHGKLSYGPGTWPAYWLLPSVDNGEGWPGSGEIDVMENWSHNAHDSVGTFHDGDIATGMHFWDGHHWSAKNRSAYPQDGRADTFHNDWHVWAVEWDEDELRFYVDKWLIGVTWNGKPVERRRVEYAAGVPDYDFYWLLNLSIAPKLGNWFENLWGDYRPEPDDFARQELKINYVRTYTECRAPSDFCPWGGTTFTEGGVPLCDLGEASSSDYWTDGGKVLKRRTGRMCLSGQDTGAGCLLWDLPPEARPTIVNGRIRSKSACSESTLQHECANPCKGQGTFDGYGCVLGVAPDGLVADLEDGVFYYRETWVGGIFSNPDCLPEHPYVSGKGCKFATVPSGRGAFVTNDNDLGKFYLEPTCNVTANMPNCPNPCPSGGKFDGFGCRLRSAPSGTVPFIYENGFYYQAINDPEPCWKGGSFDGSNCHLQDGVAGVAGAFLRGLDFYAPAQCPVIPWAQATGR